jgi:Aerotolerance regulator N-terminal/von Willebrand factor type A domain
MNPFGLFVQMPIQFSSPIGAASWAVLAGVPVGIIALYFLKLRRRPVQVPSTLLWRRSIEDLHVNSLFQRLRRNLLLFLQLLAVLLAMLALAGPRMKGMIGTGQRYVIAIDESASMTATDTSPTRFDKAKEEAKKVISEMQSNDLAMIIAFSDRARVVSNYSGNRHLLTQRIDAMKLPTQGTTSLRDALQVAAGLANPSKQVGDGVVATAVNPPRLYLYTDGGFADVEGFSLGNLEPEVVVIGPPPPPLEPAVGPEPPKRPKDTSDNVAILALQASRNDEKPDRFQVFGRVHNFRDEPVATEAKLYRHDPSKPGGAGTLLDAVALKLEPYGDQSFMFDREDGGGAATELEVRIDVKDAFPLDNKAFTVYGNPRKAQILLVTAGDRYLIDTLKTTAAETLVDLSQTTPEGYKGDPYRRDVAAGRYDLVIFDGVAPETNPEANTLYFGAFPPGKNFEGAKTVESPLILDWDIAHPLLQYIRDLRLIVISNAQIIEPPPGATAIIHSSAGSLGLVVPRSGYTDAVIAFSIMKGKDFNTNWPVHYSFPLFLFNALRVLGNAKESAGNEIHQPGQPVVLRAESLTDRVEVTSPKGAKAILKRTPQGTFVYNDGVDTGLYHVKWGKDGASTFAVNLFDERESNLATRGLAPRGVTGAQAEQFQIKIGYTPVKGNRRMTQAIKDWWKPIAVVVLSVILIEWYIYNRRVYI